MSKLSHYDGPSWDNSQEYRNFQDPKIEEDLSFISKTIDEVQEASSLLKRTVLQANNSTIKASEEEIQQAQAICQLSQQLRASTANLSTYANCALSVDGSDENGNALLGQVQQLSARSQAASKAYFSWLTLIDEESLDAFLSNPFCKTESFAISRLRKKKNELLSLDEETLIAELQVNGPTAFGNLYDEISSNITCSIAGQEGDLGLAQASGFLESSDPKLRQSAYNAINQAWSEHSSSCAAILNALSGWRLDLYKKRNIDFLSPPLHTSCITENTLSAMLSTIKDRRDIGHRAINTQRDILKCDAMGPWDLFAPFPDNSEAETRWTFEEAIKLIKDAFAGVDPSMADFVQTMVDERWIEGTLGKSKRPGAYCTKFAKSRTPRVYMSYSGGIKDLITLAHELGHAYHNWVMRDLSLSETYYPMTLAETASIFAQTLVNDHLMQECKNDNERLKVLWTDSREAEAFILNIPVRFQFEKDFYEKRKDSKLSTKDFKDLMLKSWKDWYGDTLSTGNEMFWASKLHFHISGLSFYNFPYSFGYLFSLGIYNRRETMGSSFFKNYVNLLRDTGKMTAEELAKQHLDVNLSESTFWNSSLDIVDSKINEFQHYAKKLSSQ